MAEDVSDKLFSIFNNATAIPTTPNTTPSTSTTHPRALLKVMTVETTRMSLLAAASWTPVQRVKLLLVPSIGMK